MASGRKRSAGTYGASPSMAKQVSMFDDWIRKRVGYAVARVVVVLHVASKDDIRE